MPTGTTRRYFTEAVLALATGDVSIVRPNFVQGLPSRHSKVADLLNMSSLYMIGTRPRMHVVPSSLKRMGNNLELVVVVDAVDGRFEASIELRGIFSDDDRVGQIRMSKDYPYYFTFVDNNGYDLRSDPIDLYIQPSTITQRMNTDDLRVQYIGQSRLGNKSGGLVGRLSNHQTLQKILADTIIERPFEEVLIACFEINEPSYLFHMDGSAVAEVDDDEDTAHVTEMMQSPPTSEQVVNIMEAAMIRYFRPTYNKMFVNRFPARSQKILQSCYNLDFSSLVVEVGTSSLGVRMASETVAADYSHLATFNLHVADQRRSFFNLDKSRTEKGSL